MNQLESLRSMTTVVADTGDIDAIERAQPQDATTNPSLILKSAQDERYAPIFDEALSTAKGDVDRFQDLLAVGFGRRILEVIPGRVSTEVSARLSYDMDASVAKGRRLIRLYEEAGVARERILIKLASTWEGIQAARVLEADGIHCNLTLLFSFAQGVACGEAGVTLISPFVGRIYDWYKKDRGVDDIPIAEDPGVASVKEIYTYFKKFDIKTEVMGASFRKADQVAALAGCDLLTIAPNLIDELAGRDGELPRALSVEESRASNVGRVEIDEKSFRWHHNSDPMAVEKLAQGINAFHADALKLAKFASERLAAV
ncbi:MAG: transaldolase [Planctomycetota bacterium]|jgi:transaldolase